MKRLQLTLAALAALALPGLAASAGGSALLAADWAADAQPTPTATSATTAVTSAIATRSLQCQKASITLFPCRLCGPGGGPGMSQATGPLSTGSAVTGGAVAATGIDPSTFTRGVDYSYHVPDVRVFAPDAYKTLLSPKSTQTWIVKASSAPGGQPLTLASSLREVHAGNDVDTGAWGHTDTSGNTSTNGDWLLLGQVAATSYMRGMTQNVSYGFSCRLPVVNLILQNQIYYYY